LINEYRWYRFCWKEEMKTDDVFAEAGKWWVFGKKKSLREVLVKEESFLFRGIC
jgi:hypothetical protein